MQGSKGEKAMITYQWGRENNELLETGVLEVLEGLIIVTHYKRIVIDDYL